MPSMIPFIFSQFLDDNGDPLNLGSLTFYETQTTNPLDTYADQSGNTVNQNPLTLDSAGRATIFLGNATYDIILKDALGNTIGTLEAISGSGSSSSMLAVNTVLELSALAAGAADYVLLGGEDTVGDGNGGFYYWDPDSTDGNNFPDVVIPDSDPDSGRWLLLWPITDSGAAVSGSFTITMSGCTAPITGTAYYTKIGNAVTLRIPYLTGTSNADAMELSGLPVAIQPTGISVSVIPGTKSGTDILTGIGYVHEAGGGSAGKISIATQAAFKGDFAYYNFATSGVKAFGVDSGTYACISYLL